jgi:DNA polymerase-3 subunit delta'
LEIKIEPVRRLEQRIYRSGFDSPNRVVFIPFIHKMNMNAANAFLKTLEEPPEGTVIILTASGEDDLLPTIKSRCVRLTINPLPVDALTRFIVETLGAPEADARRQAVASAGRIGVALEADKGRLALSDYIEMRFARALESRSVRDLTASLNDAVKAACEAKDIKPEGHAIRGQIMELFPLIAQCLRYALRTTLTEGYDAPLPDGWKRAVNALSRSGVERIIAVEKALTRASHGVSRYVRPSLCLRYVARRLAACCG